MKRNAVIDGYYSGYALRYLKRRSYLINNCFKKKGVLIANVVYRYY